MSPPLIKRREIVSDPWRRMADDQPLPDGGPVLVSWARWIAERAVLTRRGTEGLGVVVNAAEVTPEELGRDAGNFGVIAFEFPAFADGRAFSQAALLRARYAFHGEIRATGRILPDQLHFLERCGFDAFELPERFDPERALAIFSEFSLAYQQARDGVTPVMGRRGQHQETREPT
ncbi:MAG TPA: oxidoreductase [Gammaproteobacteria bacterium]|nr:oxidoreductase [Gammaproteobacteria bacterium]